MRFTEELRRSNVGVMRPGTRFLLKALIVLSMLSIVVVPPGLYLRKISGEIALSDATDLVMLAINEAIHAEMEDNSFDYNTFVKLETNDDGTVTAITSNMARINAMSARLLHRVVNTAGGGELVIKVPLGNLLGASMLLGRGPEVPVKIIMLTSSRADFRNDICSAGINQTRHQIILEVRVDIDVLVPWDTLSTQVVSEVLVAETVIVGSVPKLYLNG